MRIEAIYENAILKCFGGESHKTDEAYAGTDLRPTTKKRRVSTNTECEKLRIVDRSIKLVDEYGGTNNIEVTNKPVKLSLGKNGRLSVKYFQKTWQTLVEIADVSDSQMPRDEIRLLALTNNKYGITADSRLNLKLGNKLIHLKVTYSLDYSLNLENTISRKISAPLINILESRENSISAKESLKVSPQLFYKSICEHTGQLPAFEGDFDIPELETNLLKFQKKTVNWMLDKENAKYNFETNRCDQVLYFCEGDLIDEDKMLDVINKIWYGWEITEISKKKVFFNKYTSHLVTKDQVRDYLLDYLHQKDKNLYPATLPARCLLSEEMGLGKTVETTALILLNQRPVDDVDKKLSLPLNEFGDAKTIIKGRTTLIIAPSAILQQWKKEIINLAPSLALTEYKGVSNYPMFDNKPAVIAEYLRKFDVVITTYQIISKELDYAKYSSKLRKTRGAKRDTPYQDTKDNTDSSSVEVEDTLANDYSTLFQLTSLRKPQHANKKTNSSQSETDYEQALQDEIQLALRHSKIPDWYRRNEYESPLMLIQFWRIILDEVQMVSSTISKAFQSAALIPRFHAWGVSGTPIKRDLNDLFSYLKFLRFYPFNYDIGVLSWDLLLNNASEFKSFWSNIAIRHTKAMVHDDIKLPPQNRVLLTIPFTPVEQDLYDEKFSECLSHIGLDEMGNPLSNDWDPLAPAVLTLMRTWLSRLRQICCSPQVGNLQLNSRRMKRANLKNRIALIDSLKTLDYLLKDMLTRSYGELSDFERRKIEVLSQLSDLLEFVYYPEQAVKYLKVGIIETVSVINRIEKILDKYIQDYKSNSDTEVDDDDDIGRIQTDKQNEGNTNETLISSTRTRLRNWLLTLHRFYFLYASANFQLYDPEFQEHVKEFKPEVDLNPLKDVIKQFDDQGRSIELASLATSIPVSEFEFHNAFIDLGTAQENEAKYYELAEGVRVKILGSAVKQFYKTLASRISDRGYLFPLEEDFVDDAKNLLPKSSKKLFNKLPIMKMDDLTPFAITTKVQSFLSRVGAFVSVLNKISVEFNTKFSTLVELLSDPVDRKDIDIVDQGKKDADDVGDAVDNDYEKHLEMQGIAEDLLTSLDSLLMKRKGLITGSLEERFNPTQPNNIHANDKIDFSKLVSELTLLEDELEESSSKAVGLDLDLFKVFGKKFRILYDNQKLAQTLIARELNVNCNAVFNARVEYFKQLQQISDTVKLREYPYLDRKDLDPFRIRSSILGALVILKDVTRYMDSAVGRFRYLSELVKESQQSVNENREDVMTCIICQSSISIGSLTSCGHKYCKDCLEHWMKSSHTCPMCKARIDIMSVYNFTRYAPELKAKEVQNSEIKPKRGAAINSIYKPLNQDLVQEVQEIKLDASYSTKVDMIVKQASYLKKCDPNVQIVIFSQWQDMLYILSNALKSAGITFVGTDSVFLPDQSHVSSKKPKKEAAVEYFKQAENKVTCFLLNAKSQASGLTLVNATHIFLCEPLVNTSLELQAISRIHRIGQTKPTTVWMFAIENTVEESIIITSTNKRIKLIQMSAPDKEESEPSEIKLSEADSLTMMSSVGADELLEKHAQGENVTNSDLWHSFFSAKQSQQNLGF